MKGQKFKKFMSDFVAVIGKICKFCFRYRKIFLALPVLVFAGYLAWRNGAVLPDAVGILLNARGAFSLYITKTVAVWVPFGITVLCLALMSISRKVLYPWLVACLSMVLPLLIRALNQFAG